MNACLGGKRRTILRPGIPSESHPLFPNAYIPGWNLMSGIAKSSTLGQNPCLELQSPSPVASSLHGLIFLKVISPFSCFWEMKGRGIRAVGILLLFGRELWQGESTPSPARNEHLGEGRGEVRFPPSPVFGRRGPRGMRAVPFQKRRSEEMRAYLFFARKVDVSDAGFILRQPAISIISRITPARSTGICFSL